MHTRQSKVGTAMLHARDGRLKVFQRTPNEGPAHEQEAVRRDASRFEVQR